jgi:hypothetical protein
MTNDMPPPQVRIRSDLDPAITFLAHDPARQPVHQWREWAGFWRFGGVERSRAKPSTLIHRGMVKSTIEGW